MSLTSFVKMDDVKAKLQSLRPKLPRKINAPLKVALRSKRYMLVGAAFDYLLRFEIQRRAPHADAKSWVADYAPDMLRSLDLLYHKLPDAEWDEEYMAPAEVSRRARNVVEKAKAAVAAYAMTKEPDRAAQAALASHAIRLAKLDDVPRALRLDPHFEDADPQDVEELIDLLAVVPFDKLLHDKVMLLNPMFGEASAAVGGADADLITGDMLVDFKTTKSHEMQAENLDQLLGYYLLARRHYRVDPTFPAISRLALYFCRHGYLWALDANTWTKHPQFAEVEEWFFKRAKEAFSPVKCGLA